MSGQVVGGSDGAELQDGTIDPGETFIVAASSTVIVGDTLTNYGALNISSRGRLGIDGPVSLTGGGQINLGGAIISASLQTAAILLDQANGRDQLINFDNTITGDGASGSGQISVTFTNEMGGSVESNGYGNQTDISSTMTNQGVVEALSGGQITLSGVASNTGIIEATGSDTASGAGSAVQIGGTVVNGGILVSSEGGVIRIDGTVISTVTVEATLGSLIQINKTGMFTGSGVLSGSVVNNGLVEASAGTLVFNGVASGNLRIDANSTLTLAGGQSTGTVAFDPDSTLQIGVAAGAAALRLEHFNSRDAIDFVNLQYSADATSSYAVSTGILTITVGQAAATLFFGAGNTDVDGLWQISSDNLGGTLVTCSLSDPVTAAAINALYEAVLGRAVDPGGLAANQQMLAAPGQSLRTVQAGLAGSPEAGNAINTLYLQVLGRPAEPGGLAATQRALAEPGSSLGAIQVVLANSPEAAGAVGALYQAILGRPADTTGGAAFQHLLGQPGQSLGAIQAVLAGSPEAAAAINTLYLNVLGRPGDASGAAAFQQFLGQPGGSLGAIQARLAGSPEAAADINTLYQDVLGRPADAFGAAAFQQFLGQPGQSLGAVQAILAASPEAAAAIDAQYQTVLGRPVDPAGVAGFQQLLTQTQQSLATIRTDLINSPEAANDIGHIYIQFAGPQSPETLSADIKEGMTQLRAGLSLSDLTDQISFIHSAPTTINLAANVTLTASGAPELFQTQLAAVGQSIINNFHPGLDRITVSSQLNYSDIIHNGQQTVGGFQINLGGNNMVLLAQVSASMLAPYDFRFAG